jgi:hypothetical protein
MSNWKQNLNEFFQETDKSRQKEKEPELSRFMARVVMPAFQEIAAQMELHGREVTTRNTATSAAIVVSHDGDEEIRYRVQGRTFPHTVLPYAEIRYRERKGLKLITVESMLRSGPPNYTLADVSKEEVIGNFLEHYMRRVKGGS